jgi:hypothetical protein
LYCLMATNWWAVAFPFRTPNRAIPPNLN